MKITIDEKNAEKIQAALDAINGRANEHVFRAEDIDALAERAEQKLSDLSLPQSSRSGSRVSAISGRPVAKSYRHKRIANHVTLIRGAKKWALVDVSQIELWPNQGGVFAVLISPEQKDELVEKLLTSKNVFVRVETKAE